MNQRLSKSSFIKGLQCEKQLYLYKHHYNWQDKVGSNQQAIFDRGHNVGELAQDLFPGGVDASVKSPIEYQKALKKTKDLIDQGVKIIYEAAFVYNDVLVISDILVIEDDGWNIYEVKSSVSISETYEIDASIQYYVISNLGYSVKDISIVYINNQYTRNGDLDLSLLFNIESVHDKAIANQSFICEKVGRFQNVILSKRIPDIGIGMHCTDPYDCSFIGYCWKDVPKNSVFDIANLYMTKKFEIYNSGYVEIEDIPLEYLNEKQQQQVDCHVTKESIIDKVKIQGFVEDLAYPLYYLDFETFNPAIPLFDNSRPYQQICFQYSLHIQNEKGGDVEHLEFLAEANGDPRIPFIDRLINDIKPKGDILVYNKTFEITRLKELARDFTEYEEQIGSIIERIKDLMMPFQQRWYYTPEMEGSYSIKKVLPAVVDNLSYENLNIKEGGSASVAFQSLYSETDIIKTNEIRNDLLDYCKMDTLAMVKIYETLTGVI